MQQLPLNDEPEAFGMHDNADMTYAILETQKLFEAIISIDPTNKPMITTYELEEDIASKKLEDIISQLPAEFNLEEVHKKHPIAFKDSLAGILHQEVLNYNNLLKVIKDSVNVVQMALSGVSQLTEDMEEFVSRIYFGAVPKIWLQNSYLRYFFIK